MEIDYLADHEAFLPLLARWHHEEWGYLHPGDPVEARAGRLRGECGRGGIPTTVIAFSGETLLGSAMLIDHDMDTRMDLSPWLAGVFVSPGHRRKGIGTALVRRIMTEAETLAIPRLYLYTPKSESFYTRLGWRVVERTTYVNTGVVVMEVDLPNERDLEVRTAGSRQ
jgi:GNAT superfamily N-acetyltransferase